MTKIITWVDLQGRYRVTSPAYRDHTRPKVLVQEFLDAPKWKADDLTAATATSIAEEIARLGLPSDWPFHLHRGSEKYTLRRDETEDECVERTWAKVVASGASNGIPYSISIDHPRHLVEDADQRERLVECCGTYFRYGVFMLPNREDRLDGDGEAVLTRDARDGAWEMDTDGRPKVNRAKSNGIQMDHIRVARNVELEKESGSKYRQPPEIEVLFTPERKMRLQVLRDIPQTFDLDPFQTLPDLMAAWPSELPPRRLR